MLTFRMQRSGAIVKRNIDSLQPFDFAKLVRTRQKPVFREGSRTSKCPRTRPLNNNRSIRKSATQVLKDCLRVFTGRFLWIPSFDRGTLTPISLREPRAYVYS